MTTERLRDERDHLLHVQTMVRDAFDVTVRVGMDPSNHLAKLQEVGHQLDQIERQLEEAAAR